jgi:hypothetical protein
MEDLWNIRNSAIEVEDFAGCARVNRRPGLPATNPSAAES